MPIYTKTGDKGKTSLFGGKRVSKDDPQVAAYGSVDELSSFLGMPTALLKRKPDKEFLLEIQKDLYLIMGFLAGAANSKLKVIDIPTMEKRVKVFEERIDFIESRLPKLRRFILPGGSELSTWFHINRTVCRRAERAIVRLNEKTKLDKETVGVIIQYLNRLSDLFFDLARWYNKEKEILT